MMKVTMMTTNKIDPYNITNFNRTEEELQLFLLFCIVVAGKTAYIQSEKLEQFLDSVNERLMMPEDTSPFQSIRSAEQNNILFDEIKKALESGEQVKISGFGKFELRDKSGRPGRNPKTGEEIPITPRRVVTFRTGQKLKARVEAYAGTVEQQ